MVESIEMLMSKHPGAAWNKAEVEKNVHQDKKKTDMFRLKIDLLLLLLLLLELELEHVDRPLLVICGVNREPAGDKGMNDPNHPHMISFILSTEIFTILR